MRCVASLHGERTDDPVLMALADSQKTFNIPIELLEKLVQGTAMDVPRRASPNHIGRRGMRDCSTKPSISSTTTATTLLRLSVLICIRIFGYRDPRAEKLAEQTGVAFQLTNIIRDVKEDARWDASTCRAKTSPALASRRSALTNGSRCGVAAGA